MDAHLSLDLESFGEYGKCLDKLIAERPVAGHNVADLTFKQTVNASPYKGVAEIVKRPFVFREIGGRQAVAYHHVDRNITPLNSSHAKQSRIK